jgi:hypothetical protein
MVRHLISITASRSCVESFKNRLRAIILTGSMARHEATIALEDEQSRVLGDAELLLIFHDHADLPAQEAIEALGKSIEKSLRLQQVSCPISLSAGKGAYLRGLPPHIFGYELRECGRVVWGEASILSLIPPFSTADIPLEDGWRLLSNRIVEHIEVAQAWNAQVQEMPPFLQYQTIKLCLDTAASFLLFAGAYAPTYSGRQEALDYILETAPEKERFSFLQKTFAQQVSLCTQWKLGAGEPGIDLNLGRRFWESVVSSACAVWKWELSILTGLAAHADFHELCKKSMRAQNARQRARGWLFVLRESGWLRSWRRWPNWVGKVWQGSPRHWVYLAAFELFSRLDALLGNKGADPGLDVNWTEVREWLPLTGNRQANSVRGDWRQLASEIAWNYHTFVEKTRA